MKINRLEIDAFMAIGQITVDLDSKGLVLIQGENDDDTSQNSNGAGKSTVAEALCWALYNETARGDSGDEIVNRKLKKGTRVMVQLVDGPRTYNVIRHRKHPVHKNRVLLIDVTDPADPIDLTQGTDKATQEVITKLVGCTSDVFRAAIYSGQEAHIDLPSLTDKNLKMIVEEAAGIDKMQEAHVIAKNRMVEKKSAVTSLENSVNTHQAALDACLSGIKELIEGRDNYEVSRSSKASAERAAMAESVAKAKVIQAEISSLDEAGIASERAAVSARIAAVDGERVELGRLISAHGEAKLRVSTVQKRLNDEKAQATRCKEIMANVEAEIGTKCESCGHVLEASDVAGRMDSVKSKAVSHVHSAKNAAAELAEAEAAFTAATSELEAFKSSMTDLTAETERLAELDALQVKLNNLKMSMQSLVDSAKGNRARAASIESEVNPYISSIEKAELKAQEIEESIVALKASLETAREELSVAEKVVEVFSPAGIRAHILDTVTPFLNDRTSRYLGILSDGNIRATWNTISTTAKGELREKFEISVTSATGGSNYRSLSGGEKRKVRLATALALQDLVSSRAAKPIRLWIGDEIDDAVDDAGLERLMTVLEEKAKEKGTVLIISHNPIRDWVRQHVIVRKRGGLSEMEGVLCVERDTVGE